jgi:hypothetical protein
MKSISSSFMCTQRRPDSWPDVVRWARRLIADPARYGATERERQIVADLLVQAEVLPR